MTVEQRSAWLAATIGAVTVLRLLTATQAAVAEDIPSLTAAAATAKAAVVTLKLPGQTMLYGMLVDHSPDDEESSEPPNPARDIDLTLGSAVIVEPSGVAVTTARLARRGFTLTAVASDGRRFSATLVGRDEETDVAVLTLCCDTRAFPSIELSDSDRVHVGDRILAVGAPFGLATSVTASIVTSLTRDDSGGLFAPLIHTGPSVGGGYAGGPVVDTTGAMVGLVVGNNAGAGIAVPSNALRKIITALLEDGRVRRGSLGIKMQTLDADLAHAFGVPAAHGVVIVDVRPDGPAARAGLHPGDIIHDINGGRVDSASRMARMIGNLSPGRPVAMRVWQRGREQTVDLRLDEEPDPDTIGGVRWRARERLGADVDGITSDMGVVVSGVDLDGPAARAGIRRADVIREVNGHGVRILRDLDDALRGIADGPIAILLQRGSMSLYVTLKPSM